jgi:DNA replication and repair protein RecF
VTLQAIKCTNFRCLPAIEFQPGPSYTLICGANASGKTSILEAIAYLARGRSFRGATPQDLVRYGCKEFVLFGRVDTGSRQAALGVRNGRAGLEIHIDGQTATGASELAQLLPLQVIDPDVHDLVAGGPELRRRYLDWMAFHVEPGYLDTWRRFRRALRQRNAALKAGAGHAGLAGWNKEFAQLAQEVHEARLRVVDIVVPVLVEHGGALLGSGVALEYQRGWPAGKSLEECLHTPSEREWQTGSTQAGPQRADLRLAYDEHRARKRVSRGQQKLLACALILAAAEVVQTQLGKPLVLLLDDPAAELDRESLKKLMAVVAGLGSQVIATALDPAMALFPEAPRLFHVEQGVLTAAD